MQKSFPILLLCSFLGLFIHSCKDQISDINSTYNYKLPNYDSTRLIALPDTIHFWLKEDVYTSIRSFNLFYQHNVPYITFYDERSQSINVYNFTNKRFFGKLKIKQLFKKQQLYKTSVYVKNLDSIFIVNDKNISLYDTSGKQKNNIDLIEKSKIARAVLDNNNPVFTVGRKAYAIVRSNVDDKSKKELQQWKTLYEFNLENNSAKLLYHLPQLYHENLYGDRFLEYNYCYNNQGNFVFSFPADTSIYETNLRDYHYAYFARSKFQQDYIQPVPKDALESEQGRKEYSIRYSYGSIFFDPFRKCYLRFVKHKINELEFLNKSRKRRETVLIFNEDFKIIGESDWIEGVDFDSIFFTKDGQIYARTNFRDENALHFVRLTYQNNNSTSVQLSKK